MTTDAEWAWAAGLFEGEGHIGLIPFMSANGVTELFRRRLSLNMCDEDVVRRFRETVGAGEIYYRLGAKDHWSPQWTWQLTRWEDIERVLDRMLPWLGERRGIRAGELLIHGPQKRMHCRVGHEYTPENTYVHAGKRACRKCRAKQRRTQRKERRERERAAR